MAIPSSENPGSGLLRLFLAALGFSTIALFWLLKPGVDSSQRAYYHWHHHPANLALSCAIDLLTLTAILALLLFACHRSGKLRVALWAGLLSFLPWVVFANVIAVLQTTMVVAPKRKQSFVLFFGALLFTSALTSLWRPSWSSRFEKVIAPAATILVFAGIFGCFLLSKLAWYGYQAGHLAGKLPLHHQQTAAIVQPHRIFWIVLDELSYDQVYDHRFPGLRLPAFDELAKQSTLFTQVKPPDYYTQIIMPGLLSGKAWDDIRTPIGGPLWVDRSGSWTRFDPHDSVFQDALNQGYSTAVAGWYNPYCRIASSVLDQCFTAFSDTIANNMVTSSTVLANAISPLYTMESIFLTPLPYNVQVAIQKHSQFPGASMHVASLHIKDYQALDAESTRLIRDRSAGFVLLHLPVPHPYGIFNRVTGKFDSNTSRPESSYIDNLALADKCLARLRQALEETGQWDSSTIAVMGDHGWRAGMWQVQQKLTPEEVAASNGGHYEHRPVYLVKLPGQTVGVRIDTTFPAVATRKLFDGILSHAIETPEQLASWAQTVH
jgi:hypothetical protein